MPDPAKSISPPAQRPCLLIVDDTPANIDVLVGILKSDYELKVANRGAKALQICAQPRLPDLILLDVMMPEMDGFEVCSQLRANPATCDIPIIFLTATTDVQAVVRAFESGANDYVTKPFQPRELLARVSTQLTLASQRREIEARNLELRELLQLVCHDVSNQFTVIQMAMDIVTRNPGLPLDRYLPHIRAAARNGIGLTRLVRQLRRVEDQGIQLEPVDIVSCLNEALLLAEQNLRSKEIRIELETEPTCALAEPNSLTNSVFGNLLSNAIKFSPRGSAIWIRVWRVAHTVHISFQDQGIGMSPAMVRALFDFTANRSRQGTEGESGTGFGMPLMRRFLNLYGGSIEVVSVEAATNPQQHGTEFRLTLKGC
jgi:two-component system, sensor histidine kinase and response regulator